MGWGHGGKGYWHHGHHHHHHGHGFGKAVAEAAVLGSAKLGEVARSFEVWRFSSHPQQFQDQKTSVKRHQMLHTYNFFIAVAALEAQL